MYGNVGTQINKLSTNLDCLLQGGRSQREPEAIEQCRMELNGWRKKEEII